MNYNSKHYVTHQELTEFLKSAAKLHPDYCELESIGVTEENRDIWLFTLTNKKTGPAQTKPALWVDGNIHAVEVASTQACVHTIHHILTNRAKDSSLQDILDHQTLYFIPRISPDGAERILTTPEFMRSKPKIYPHTSTRPGHYPKDVNKDGFVGLMRIKDSTGPWKISKSDPRLMILRSPDERDTAEIYYRMYIEGETGPTETNDITPRSRFGIDLNRQFPFEWAPEKQQMGAGPYPLSEVESRSVIEALSARPNVYAMLSLHTFSRVIIRPLTNDPDSDLPPKDLEIFKRLDQRASEVSSYSTVSGYHGFKYDPKAKLHGGLMEWAYGVKGILANVVEIWHLAMEAGLQPTDLVDWLLEPIAEKEMLQILKWCDSNLEKGSFFKDWQDYEHPQLGFVELGGWKTKFTWSNPPENFLPAEMDKIKELILLYCKIAPRVKITQQSIKKIGHDLKGEPITKIEITLANEGFLPTSGSQKAIDLGAVQKPRAIFSSQDLEIIAGERYAEFFHLNGRSHLGLLKNMVVSHLFGTTSPSEHSASFTWVVSGIGTGEIQFEFERANRLTFKFSAPHTPP